jgi:hypothetical protein
MPFDISKYSLFLEEVARDIDIPPGKYRDAVERYNAVGRWLDEGQYPGCTRPLDIYVQGSFRLGTVVRPIRDGVEASYDIDLVSEVPLPKATTNPGDLKAMIGRRLMEHETYRKMLDEEGRRCWTLEYAEKDGAGFHLDVLPALPDPRFGKNTAIAITNRQGRSYSYSASDPRGYGAWFDLKNGVAFLRTSFAQKRLIQESAPHVFASVNDVPDQLVRTPLQRAIQLEKRHRDVMFKDPATCAYAPISVIITTLSAHLYQNETNVYSALAGIVGRLAAHTGLLEGHALERSIADMGLIRRTPDGKWYIGNPVNPEENFADRWHEDNHARAKAFFAWVAQLRADLVNVPANSTRAMLSERFTRALGAIPVTRHLDIILPADPPPRIQISSPAKPWRR